MVLRSIVTCRRGEDRFSSLSLPRTSPKRNRRRGCRVRFRLFVTIDPCLLLGLERTCACAPHMSAFGGKAADTIGHAMIMHSGLTLIATKEKGPPRWGLCGDPLGRERRVLSRDGDGVTARLL